jgi:hypothetical protein
MSTLFKQLPALCLLLFVFSSHCQADLFPPSRSYQADPVKHFVIAEQDISKLPGRPFIVSANQPWQDSGIRLHDGERFTVTAKGKWSPWPLMLLWSGPEGNADWSGHEVPWITSGALMGRIGEGQPFEIGAQGSFIANSGGKLLFAMNDPFDYLSDNLGSIDSAIYVAAREARPEPAYVTAKTSDGRPGLALDKAPRVALLIGNSNYRNSPLANPANDASDMAALLQSRGFEVDLLLDANQEQMETAIGEFGARLHQSGTIGLFYYAGHAVQIDGANYLIPLGAQLRRQKDVRYKAVDVNQVLDEMGAARNGFNMLILDACRNNPLPRSFRSAAVGLSRLDGPKGTLIAYATTPGSVAEDGAGRNGTYTKYLLQHMQTPGLPVEQVFKRVLRGVESETGGRQVPWTSSSFSGDFYFSR